MDLRQICRSDFQEYIKIAPDIPEELRRALKANERVPMFVDKLSAQLAKVDPKLLNRAKIKSVVYDFSQFFISNLKRKADEMFLSDLEKSRIKAEWESKNCLDRNGNGFIPDLEVKVEDSKETQKQNGPPGNQT